MFITILFIGHIHPPRGVLPGAFLIGYGFLGIFIDVSRELSKKHLVYRIL
jgi:prolipoprotein diacylglyceryltransferase